MDRQLQSFNLQKCQDKPKLGAANTCPTSFPGLGATAWISLCLLPPYWFVFVVFFKRVWHPLNIHSLFFPFHHRFILKSNLSPWLFISNIPLTSCWNMKLNPFHHKFFKIPFFWISKSPYPLAELQNWMYNKPWCTYSPDHHHYWCSKEIRRNDYPVPPCNWFIWLHAGIYKLILIMYLSQPLRLSTKSKFTHMYVRE